MLRRIRNSFVIATLTLAVFAQSSAPKYRDPKLAIEDRVADLLSRMTLEEKVDEIYGGDNPKSRCSIPRAPTSADQAPGRLAGAL